MKKIEAMSRPERMEPVKHALIEAGVTGLHVENVVGHGNQRGVVHHSRGGESYVIDMLPKVKLVTVISDWNVDIDLLIFADSEEICVENPIHGRMTLQIFENHILFLSAGLYLHDS